MRQWSKKKLHECDLAGRCQRSGEEEGSELCPSEVDDLHPYLHMSEDSGVRVASQRSGVDEQ